MIGSSLVALATIKVRLFKGGKVAFNDSTSNVVSGLRTGPNQNKTTKLKIYKDFQKFFNKSRTLHK